MSNKFQVGDKIRVLESGEEAAWPQGVLKAGAVHEVTSIPVEVGDLPSPFLVNLDGDDGQAWYVEFFDKVDGVA